MGSPATPFDLTCVTPKGQVQGDSEFDSLYLEKEPYTIKTIWGPGMGDPKALSDLTVGERERSESRSLRR